VTVAEHSAGAVTVLAAALLLLVAGSVAVALWLGHRR
jgi:hypothetical protein